MGTKKEKVGLLNPFFNKKREETWENLFCSKLFSCMAFILCAIFIDDVAH